MLNDESYMKLAVSLARRGMGHVSPNPMVGCVIVKDEKIIGAGYHEVFGGPHAEVNAINNAKESVEGATLVVNLEPCSHHGKTPPCTDLIIEKKIARVVIGTADPNPLVNGKGIEKLKSNGIEVSSQVLADECRELNKFFFKSIEHELPYITLKIAQTIDGKIADIHKYSKWITSEHARRYVHMLRSRYDAVLVGLGTVKKDDPRLTVRFIEGRNPTKIILDSKLSIDAKHSLFYNNKGEKVIIVTSNDSKKKRRKVTKLENLGATILFTRKNPNGTINIKSMLKALREEQISSILVEGGQKIYTSFINSQMYDEIRTIISPKILGKGYGLVGDLGIRNIEKAIQLKLRKVEQLGDDILIDLRK